MKRDDFIDGISSLSYEMLFETDRMRHTEKKNYSFGVILVCAASVILLAVTGYFVQRNIIRPSSVSGGYSEESGGYNTDVSYDESAVPTNVLETVESEVLPLMDYGMADETSIPADIVKTIEDCREKITDAGYYLGIEYDKDSLYLLKPFVIYEEDGTMTNPGHEIWYFPVISDGKVVYSAVCSYGMGDVSFTMAYNSLVSQCLTDNLNRRIVVVHHYREAPEGETILEGETPNLVDAPEFVLREIGGEHPATGNVFLDLSLTGTEN